MRVLLPTLYTVRNYPISRWVFLGLSVYGVSFLAWLFPSLQTPVFIILTLSLLLITIYSLEWGIAFIFFEIILGSFGRWVIMSVGGTLISIRIGLFAALMVGWVIHCFVQRYTVQFLKQRIFEFFKQSPWIWIGMIAASYGVMRGYFLGNDLHRLFDDSNQWLILAIVLPIACAHRVRLKIFLSRVWINGSVSLGLFALILLYIFTHDGTFGIGLALYRWSRDTHIGELTTLSSSFLRIFLQSQILILPLWLSLIGVRTLSRPLKGLSIVLASSLLLSFSRSFAVALLVILSISFFVPLPTLRRERLGRILASIFLGGILVFGVSQFPLPKAQGGSLTASLIERSTLSDAATSSRWSLLPALWQGVKVHPLLGSGLGATITYRSSDPRVLELNPTGTYSTHAFEWGVLDLWYKFGLWGLVWYVSILLFAVHLVKKGQWIAALSVALLAIVHVFTPYLNHPIGFAALLLITLLSAEDDLPTALFDTWANPVKLSVR